MSNKEKQQFERVLQQHGFVLVSIQITTEEQPFKSRTRRFNSYEEFDNALSEIDAAYRAAEIMLLDLVAEIIEDLEPMMVDEKYLNHRMWSAAHHLTEIGQFTEELLHALPKPTGGKRIHEEGSN